jgi:hypothetical protein
LLEALRLGAATARAAGATPYPPKNSVFIIGHILMIKYTAPTMAPARKKRYLIKVHMAAS